MAMQLPSEMQAVVLVARNTIELKSNAPVPKPKPGEALIRIAAAALNRRDYWITKGLYPGIVVRSIFPLFFPLWLVPLCP
jgi:NADPH:quinone reductase-like Zn-dependent oxidoreductase